MKSALPALTFVLRHFLFVVIATLAGCVLWTITYGVLLLVALVGNHGVGGLLAYPAGIIGIVASCILLGWGVFAPSSCIGALFCALFRLPKIAAIPFVFGSAFLWSYLIYWAYIEFMTTSPLPSVGTVFKNYTISLSVPLGIYWWLTEGPGALFDTARRWVLHRESRK